MSADEKISIEITDKVAPSIQAKLKAMAADSRTAATSIASLKTALDSLSKVNGLTTLQQNLAKIANSFKGAADAASKLSAAASKTALANQKLATELQKTQVQVANVEAALQRAIAAQTKAAIAASQLSAAQSKASVEAQKLATAQQQTAAAATKAAEALVRLATAHTNAATAAQRLSTESQRTATAQSNAATAATRVLTEQQRLAAATVRVTTEQAKAATAAQKLATEEQRTATAAANAASASDRAALAALRLAQAQKEAGSASGSAANSMAQYVKAALAAVGVTLGAGEIIKTADAYTLLQNKLQNVATSQDQVNEITERLFDIAERTRSSIDSTSTAFARFDRSLKGMGKSQEDTLRLTETINKALIVGGASATEASSALLQLSQAFNAGYLMGDEFRSVSENMPMVLDAVSKTLNKPIDQIKKLAAEGKITAKVMYDAFVSIQGSVDSTFGKMNVTVAQAGVVLETAFIKYVGEVNKAYGITNAISGAIIILSKHMKDLAFGAALVGIALAAAFGPTLVSLFNLATAAALRFGVALAANPIGLAIVTIAALTAAIITYGDEVYVSSKRAVTLKDAFRTAFSDISQYVSEATAYFGALWDSIIDGLNSVTGGWAEQFRDVFAATERFAKTYVNNLIGLWVGASRAITIIWQNFPALMNGFFIDTVNFVSTAVSQILNLWQTGLRSIANMISTVTPTLSANLLSGLDALKIELPKMDVSKTAQTAAEDLKKTITDSLNTDYIGQFMDRAAKQALQRRQAAGVRGKNETQLRPEGQNQLSGISSADAKAAESRAKSMAKVNAELDNEINRMGMLKPLRDAQAKYDQIEESLIGKKIKLTDSESASIKERIATVQKATVVQAQFDRIYEEAVGPARDYNATLSAAQTLLKAGSITQTEYAKQIAKAKEAYADSVNPLRETNIQLDQQMALLKQTQPVREVSQQMQQVENQLRSQGLSLINSSTGALTKEGAELQKKLLVIQELTDVQQQYDAIYSQTKGAETANAAAIKATTQARQNGIISAEQYGVRLNQLAVQAAQIRIQAGTEFGTDGTLATFGAIIQGYQGLLSGLTQSFGELFVGITDGFANAIAGAVMGTETLGDALRNVAQQAVQQLIASLIKLGIQYTINAAIGNSVAGAATAASVGLAGTTAVAWAPAAAAVSLASFGANAAPAEAGIIAANTTSMGFALAGFSDGGYTGNVGTDAIAGVVHGKEFVMNAEATQRIGVGNLQAMQDGRSNAVQASGSSANSVGTSSSAPNVTVTVINNSSNSEVTTSKSEDADGNIDFITTIDNIENSLASRMASGRGPLNSATKNQFGLQNQPQGKR